LQSVIRRNANEIHRLEESINNYYQLMVNETSKYKSKACTATRRKIKKLAALQVTLKKSLRDLHYYERTYGPYA